MSLPRGIKNNNPANIRWDEDWQGLVTQQKRTDKEFCQFRDSISGLRVLVRLMLRYEQQQGLQSVEGIINYCLTTAETNSIGYIERICQALAVLPKQPIKLTDTALKLLIKAIIALENGAAYYNHYSIDLIERTIQQARNLEQIA